MRVLYIATSFPEPHIGATIYTDLAEALHKAGHEITVAVSEQAGSKKKTEIKKERGFDVFRVETGKYYDVGFIRKGITTLNMPVLMRKQIKKYLKNREFDLILFESPPVTNGELAAWAKKKFNCSAYLMLKDIFPQNAVDLRLMRQSSLVFRYFKKKEKRLYKIADKIGCMSMANKDYILSHNPWLEKKNKVEIFPNTKKLAKEIQCTGFPMRERYGIPKDSCVFLFGGNMGRPQYINLLCYAIRKCSNEKKIYFLFVGRGTERYMLEQTIKKNLIKNARLLENLPRYEYEQIIKECDVGLIVLDPRFTIPNYPSRILNYMEYAKPVLAASDKVTDMKELIENAQCGQWVWSGDCKSFVNKIKEMSRDKELSETGKNGRNYIEENFRVDRSVAILEKHFDTWRKR